MDNFFFQERKKDTFLDSNEVIYFFLCFSYKLSPLNMLKMWKMSKPVNFSPRTPTSKTDPAKCGSMLKAYDMIIHAEVGSLFPSASTYCME